MPMTWASWAWRRISSAVRIARDGMRSSEWDTIWSRPKRSSIRGLKISTRWRAIWARRSRRISSSVLPLYMLPTITSIQPVFDRGRVGSVMAGGGYRDAAQRVNGAAPARDVDATLMRRAALLRPS